MTEIIAEIGWNHMGDVKLAKKMILEAKKNGADYVKTQIFDVKRLKTGPWDKDGRRNIYLKAQLNYKKMRILYEYSKKIKIVFFASVLSIPDAKLLLKFSNKIVKIPSAETNNLELIKFCSKKFNHVIISTGASYFNEIKKIIKNNNFKKLTLLHCVSSYPCDIKFANLNKIISLRKVNKIVGFSDHCSGIDASILSLKFDPSIIEKHFTINKKLPGRDNKFAILPFELKNLKNFIINQKLVEMKRGNNFQSIEKDTRRFYRGRFNLIKK